MTAPPLADIAPPTLSTENADDTSLAEALNLRAESNGTIFGLTNESPASPPDKAPDASAVPAVPSTPATPAPDGTAPADQPPAPDAPDPFAALLADAQPLTFTRNGMAETTDAILEIPGKGALISADKLEEVRNLYARYESNAADAKQLYEQARQFDALTHTVTEPDGKQAVLHGTEAFHRLAENYAALNAVALPMFELLTQPQQLLGLLTLNAQNEVVPDMGKIEAFRERAKFLSERATFDARQSRTTQQAEAQTSVAEAAVRQTAIPDAIDQAFKDAHPDDRAAAKAHFSQFPGDLLFKVTPETAAHYGQPVGTLMVAYGKMDGWFKDRATLRQSSQAATAAATKAAAENARRLASPPKPVAPPTQPRDKSGQFVETKKKLSASEIFDRARSGRSIVQSVPTE